VCSTHRNYFFKEKYPEIQFIEPGEVAYSIYAKFGIGWYYKEDGQIDYSKNPVDFKKFPLQQTASDILNIPYKEIKPRISVKDGVRTIPGDKPYVCIAPHGSALAKYWNQPGGWQELIYHIKRSGYDVVMITQEPLGDSWHDSKLGGTLKGVINKTGDLPLDDRINDLRHSAGFIGIGSGLSWLSWAVGTPVMMISGFSESWTEFDDCVRIINETGCKGCFNRSR
jgi:autotransporter strand-loop-strand O-heptosyltransferase